MDQSDIGLPLIIVQQQIPHQPARNGCQHKLWFEQGPQPLKGYPKTLPGRQYGRQLFKYPVLEPGH
ncbi:hypothetical protein BCY88_12050 [Paraburkholderia fungorum]|uniref:Uncharacterized protein n=1 Tax=Paraburkholderia fungorum TaxID=134537 RepID=A0A420FEQ0_9BURK|nr:hypothetical protein BCY88_12050 [Paraburkholderia fungorum]